MCRTNKLAGQETENVSDKMLQEEVKIHQAVNDSVMKNLTEEVSDKMIGCLCWFSDSQNALWEVVGVLKRIVNISPQTKVYVTDAGKAYGYCRPVKPDEVKFYDHIGDDNEKVELVQKMHILENRIVELEATNKELSEQLFSCGRDWFLAQRELDILRSK